MNESHVFHQHGSQGTGINISSGNSSEVRSKMFDSVLFTTFMNSFAMSISCLNIVLTLCAVVTLYRCKRMSFQIKRLSYNLFFSDMLLHTCFVPIFLWTILLAQGHTTKGSVELLKAVRVGTGATSVLVSLASVAAITLDRLVAITKPLRYNSILNKRVISAITSYVWLVNTCVPLTVFVSVILLKSNSLDYRHGDPLHLEFRIVVASFYIIYHSFIIYAYFKISKGTRNTISVGEQESNAPVSTIENKLPRVTGSSRFSTTHTIVKIVLTFELTNLPIFVHSIFFLFFPCLQEEKAIIAFQTLSYCCSCGNLYVCFFLYVWKMKECRYVFLSTFCLWRKCVRESVESLKHDVYDIVPYGGHPTKASFSE